MSKQRKGGRDIGNGPNRPVRCKVGKHDPGFNIIVSTMPERIRAVMEKRCKKCFSRLPITPLEQLILARDAKAEMVKAKLAHGR